MPLRVGRVGAGLVGAAVAIRVLVLPVAPATRAIDVVMVGLALCVGAAPDPPAVSLGGASSAHRRSRDGGAGGARRRRPPRGRARAAGLRDDRRGGFAAILVGIETDDSPSAPARRRVAAVIVVFVVLWMTSAPAGSGASLLVAVALLVGIRLLALGGAEHTRGHIDAETRRGHVYATLGRKLGRCSRRAVGRVGGAGSVPRDLPRDLERAGAHERPGRRSAEVTRRLPGGDRGRDGRTGV